MALGVAAEWSSYLPEDPAAAAGDFAVGMAFIAGGLLVLRRSTPTAVLMTATGVAWFAGGLATGLVFLHRGPLVHLLLSYPRGRLDSRIARAVVAAAYVDGALYPLGRSNVATLVLAAAVLAAALARHARAGGPARRARATALASTAAFAAVLATAAVARLADAGQDAALLWAYEGVLALSAAALCIDLRWGRWAQAAATGLVVDLGGLDREATLRARLARSVGDPSLRLGYWQPERSRYVDEAGEAIDLAEAQRGQTLVLVRDEDGRPAAAILHDPAVLDQPELVEAAHAAVRIAVANLDLQAQILRRVEEVRASRRRLVEAADAERLRLERELIGAAERRLEAIAEMLGETAPEEVTRELEAIRADLRELAHGIHPRALTESGLAAALDELAARFPVPVELSAAGGPLPAPLAAAGYFVCSEGLANAAKHAGASRVRIEVRTGASLAIEVADDGAGGADPVAGSGLRGLADRVEALGGTLSVDSPAGGGTRLRADIPLEQRGEPGPLVRAEAVA